MKKNIKILIVDDEEPIRTLLSTHFLNLGFEVTTVDSATAAAESIGKQEFDVVVSDIKMPKHDGFWLLDKIFTLEAPLCHLPMILITGHGEKDCAIQAVNKGAFGYIEKPFDLEHLDTLIEKAIENFQLSAQRWREREALKRQVQQDTHIPPFIPHRETLQRLAPERETPVLILGPSGSGKEVWAKNLHRQTQKTFDNFVAINCAAMPSELLESEIFGHEKGSFTGAHQAKAGLAELSSEGTLFLDEIGDMDLRLQAKILRFLQERCFRRVGGSREIHFKGRVVAATHRDLGLLSKEQKFREDLFYRLSVVTVSLPSLTERDDRLELAEFLWVQLGKRRGVVRALTMEEKAFITSYPWPGNVRELQNCLERAIIMNEPINAIRARAHLPGSLSVTEKTQVTSDDDLSTLRRRLLNEAEMKALEIALQKTNGNKTKAAQLLGIDRTTLNRILKKVA